MSGKKTRNRKTEKGAALLFWNAPRFWRTWCRARNGMRAMRYNPRRLWARPANPWKHLEDAEQYASLLKRYPAPSFSSGNVRVGVILDHQGQHAKFENACREMGVAHVQVDIRRADWIDRVRDAGCRGFLCHVTADCRPWKDLYEERLRVLASDLGCTVHPEPSALWLYESKRRTAYWLQAHSLAHPATHLFYDREEAFAYAMQAEYPMVVKTDLGSGASGVAVLQRPRDAYRWIASAFSSGLLGSSRDLRDREWGYILFQDYVPRALEYRVIQIGSSWFGHEKLSDPRTGLHSGSGRSAWSIPPDRVFDFCREVSLLGQFEAMNYDVFLTEDGRVLVNELQVFFSAYNPSQMYREGVPGRLRFENGEWRFEEGLFCRNGCANLRVELLLEKIRERDREGSLK